MAFVSYKWYDVSMIQFTEQDGVVIARFSDEAVRLADKKARQRRSSARSKGRQQAYFIEGTKWDSVTTEVKSMMAEYAVAHYFGQIEWEPVLGRPDRDDGDVVVNGKPIEVKSTDRRNGCLPLKEDEKRNRPYVLALVDVNSKTVTLAGWQMAQNCKQQQWWRSDVRYPAYFVPQKALRPMSLLRRALDVGSDS